MRSVVLAVVVAAGLTPEERERAQAEAQAIRDGANRENLPRPTGNSR